MFDLLQAARLLFPVSQGFNTVLEAIIGFLILIILGAIIIIVVGALVFFIPAAVIAFVVWFLTGNTTWAAIAFLVIAVLSLARKV